MTNRSSGRPLLSLRNADNIYMLRNGGCMAKTNAQRQADYRHRRDSERISETQLQWLLYLAYNAGREDREEGKMVTFSRLYDRIVDRALDVEFRVSHLE